MTAKGNTEKQSVANLLIIYWFTTSYLIPALLGLWIEIECEIWMSATIVQGVHHDFPIWILQHRSVVESKSSMRTPLFCAKLNEDMKDAS